MITVNNVSLQFGKRVLYKDVNLKFTPGNCYGIIGANGAGKSTFLKLLAGDIEPTGGTIEITPGERLAVLQQDHYAYDEYEVLRTVIMGHKRLVEIMDEKDALYAKPDFSEEDGMRASELEAEFAELNGWDAESEAARLLNGLGIPEEEHTMKMADLTAKEKVRVLLAQALFGSPDILLLDEPTNHLDSGMVRWIEEYLGKFKGVLIMVTHDRYFLDRVTNKIVEIDRGSLYSYDANFSGYLELKQARLDQQAASYRKVQSILRTEIEWVRRGAQARSTKQKARLERFEQMQNMKAPEQDKQVEMDSLASRLGKKTIELEHISKAYDGRTLISDFTYYTIRNERIGIVGPNGCGKTTLLKIILGLEQPDNGSVTIGETIQIGYFSQMVEDMNPEERVIDYVKNVAEYIKTSKGTTSASQMCERFLFGPETQYNPIGKLSGGEKRRLYLLKVLMAAPNVLILDEPTNDLDITTLAVLEEYLDYFEGIVITVSHDRYFLDRVVNRIFAFEGNGVITQYEGGYTDYLEKAIATGKLNDSV